jgi:hypothetical protein
MPTLRYNAFGASGEGENMLIAEVPQKARIWPALNQQIVLIALLIFAIALIARVLPGPRNVDDSFITFRYSRNIVEGHGFLYNPGQTPTLGTTTPLFTGLMAVMSFITGGQDFPWYALTVSALADGITCVLIYGIARRLIQHDWLAAIPAVLWAIAPRSVTFAVGGMETSVNILWMVAAYWLYTQPSAAQESEGWQRPALIGVCAGLGFLTRIDSVLWFGPLFVFQLVDTWTRRASSLPDRLPWKTWLSFGLVILPWLIFGFVYFGSPFPRSLGAKAIAYQMPALSALVLFIQVYATPFFEASSGALIGILAVVYLFLSLIGILYATRRSARLLPFLIYPWLYMIVFSAANPLIFRWYLTPPLPALMLSIFMGIWAIFSGLQSKLGEKGRWALAGVGLIGLIWSGTSLSEWRLHPDHGLDRPAPDMAWHKQESFYLEIALQLRDEYGVTPDTLVAAGDIGVIGYFSRATILDTVGLVTPSLSRYYPVDKTIIVPGQNYAIPPTIILDNDPAFLVVMEAAVRLGLEQNAEFKAEYERVNEIPTDFYGTGMYLYKRRG